MPVNDKILITANSVQVPMYLQPTGGFYEY